MLSEANAYRYAFMRPSKIRDVLARCPVAIQPVGLLEWHGDQNPIGLDGLAAQYICERAIVRIGGGALLPTSWVGTYGYARYPGGVVFDPGTTRSVFLQQYRELLKVGFKVVLLLTGHWGATQEGALGAARDMAESETRAKGLRVKLLGLRWCDFLFPKTSYGGHAQEGETSIAWRIAEAYGVPLVDVSSFKTGVERPSMYDVDPSVPRKEPPEWPWPKDLKDGETCNPEIGERFISSIAEGIAEELVEALSELGIAWMFSSVHDEIVDDKH